MYHLNTISDFRALYDLRFNNLVIYATGLGVPYQQAKDIVQECFIKLWENRDSVTNHTAYLFISVKNLSLNWLKSNARTAGKQVSLEEIPPRKSSDQTFEEAMEYFRKVETAYRKIGELGGRCKDIFVMVYIEKMKIKEVADELGISENTVKTYLKRGKEAIRLLIPSIIVPLYLLQL